jgi:acetyltransferase-like isoleucine patch superfamily enzyme
MADWDLIEGILRWKFRRWEFPTFDENGLTKWQWMVQYPENLKMGKYVDIGVFTYLNAKYGIVLEDFVQIGSHCSIYSVSSIDGKKGTVIIKRNARIGSHSVVLPGVTVGENSIIGAYSLVNKDVPPNVVAFGIPVKVYRSLTQEEITIMIKAMEEVENIKNGDKT